MRLQHEKPEIKEPFEAVGPRGNRMSVTVTGRKLHGDKNLFRSETIGHWKDYSKRDYIAANDTKFCSFSRGCRLVDIGRYAPFVMQD